MNNSDTDVSSSSIAIAMSRLTERQRDCLSLLGQGYRIKEIAIELGNSPETVKQHLAAARKALNASTSLMAARAFAEWQLANAHRDEPTNPKSPSISAFAREETPPPKEVNPPSRLVEEALVEPSFDSSRAWRRRLGPLGWLVPAHKGATNDLSSVQRIIVLVALPLVIIMVTVGALTSYETLLRLLLRLTSRL